MFAIKTIFHDIELTQAERDVIQQALSNPVLQKYFNMLAFTAMREISLALPRERETNEEFQRRMQHAKGSLIALEQLIKEGQEWLDNQPSISSQPNQ